MSELKLGKLPDRTPVKITITVSPDLNQALRQYAAIYRTAYGEAESVSNLIPFMLGAFLESDRAFAKARKEVSLDAPIETARHRRVRRAPSEPPSTTATRNETMSVIGTFTPAKDGGWTGAIHTLTINTKVRLVPNDNRDNENAPVFRVFVGQSRVGDAWAARSGGDNPKDYLRVRLDDPGLPEPLSAALFQSDDGNGAQLVWNRRKAEGATR